MIPEADRQSALEYEKWIADVIRHRTPATEKRWWESAGLISSLTAILTVALTSIAGYYTQSALRKAEERTHQTLAEYEREVAVLQGAHTLAAEATHYATERNRIRNGTYKQLSTAQIKGLVDSVNAADTKWRQGREINRVGIELQFGEAGAVLQAWDTLAQRLDKYATCTVVEPPQNCAVMRPPVDSSISAFRHLAVTFIRKRSQM